MSKKWNSTEQDQFLTEMISKFGEVVTRRQVEDFAVSKKLPYPRFIIDSAEYKVSRGTYDLKPKAVVPEPAMAVVPMVRQKKMETVVDDMIPLKDSGYVPFGFYRDMKSIISSKIFYPVFVTGLSGNGKTTMVEQVCAELKRECVRVNVSVETDEDDLIGGNTLIDGNIVYREGPVLLAMKRGAILLIDECDRGSNKLMCLQAVLEGKPLYIKKTGAVVNPETGFNVIATANTKGRGSEDGRFTGARILDEAFLERFVATMDQPYPTTAVEKKIILNAMEASGKLDGEFADNLVTWSDIIRQTYKDGGVDDLISTRRLVHIARSYGIFGDRAKAIELCISRFDEDTRVAFLDLYTKVDSKAVQPVVEREFVEPPVKNDEVTPF